MNLSFNIITYTSEHEIAKKQNPKGFKPIAENPFSPKVDDVLAPIVIGLFVLNLGLFLGACASYTNDYLQDILVTILKYSILFMILFYAAIGIISTVHTYKKDLKTDMSFHDLGEKIHFYDEYIKIINPQYTITHTFPYKDIQQLTLCYKEVSIPYSTQIAIFRWQQEGKVYQYMTEADESHHKQALKDLLHYFYTNKIPVHEIDGNGKKTFMLNEEYTPKKPEIAPEIQSLIDEIGEDEKV